MARNRLLLSATALALLAGSALAQDTTTDTDTGTGIQDSVETAPMPSFTDISDMMVDDAVGWTVFDIEGNRIGKIDDILDDAGTAAAVIGIGGFLGLGEHTVAIPLSDFELGPEGSSFLLATDKDTLKEMPEFDESGAESLPGETRLAELIEPSGETDDSGATGETGDTGEAETGDTGEIEADDS